MASIDPRVDIGHVHLKVADVDRSLAFYRDVLGFELQQRWGAACLMSVGLVLVLVAVSETATWHWLSAKTVICIAAGLVVLALVRRRPLWVAAAAATIGIAIGWAHAFPSIAPTGRWTQADLAYQHRFAREHPGADPSSATSQNEPSIRSHLTSLRDGARTVVHHPQGYGLGNAGQTASRTGTPIKAGESNYTELGAETGVLGSLLWTAWGLALLVGLIRVRAPALAAGFAAALVLAVQTDVIGDPWIAYVLWTLAGIALASVALAADGDRPASGHRPRPPQGERPRPRDRVLP